MQQRKIVGVLNAWTQKVQGLTFAIVVLVGCFAVMDGDMTTGALVACSILSSRMLAPIAQLTGVLGRWQQAKIAKTSLDELMKKNNQWNHMNQISADISMQQRKIVGVLNAWTQKVQGLTFAIVVLVGCFAVMDGDMTTGALVACSILSSRMLAPIAQLTGVLGRWQQAKIAKTSLDELMKKNVDQPDRAHLIHRSALHGS
ncbi:hypothetical protein GWI33_011080, partial [Rhynchophorus ferrugineus]